MSDFFPDPEPVPPPVEEPPQPVWMNPPEDVLPGVVPVELVLGRSEAAVVMLTGMRAFEVGVAMTLHVRLRERIRGFDVHEETFDSHYERDLDDESWRRERLKWGFQFADGRKATNVGSDPFEGERTEDRPVLWGGGGGGGRLTVDRDYWLWPLPPPGDLVVVCQWPQLQIAPVSHTLDGGAIVDAAARAQPVWPS